MNHEAVPLKFHLCLKCADIFLAHIKPQRLSASQSLTGVVEDRDIVTQWQRNLYVMRVKSSSVSTWLIAWHILNFFQLHFHLIQMYSCCVMKLKVEKPVLELHLHVTEIWHLDATPWKGWKLAPVPQLPAMQIKFKLVWKCHTTGLCGTPFL